MMRWQVVFIVLMSSIGSLKAQSPDNPFPARTAEVTVRATLIDNIGLITIRDVNLDGASTVDGFINVSPIRSQYAGMMRITGGPGKKVRITYLTSETLEELNGSTGVVQARYFLSGFETDNQNASVLFDVGEATVTLGPDGNYFIWLGANLDLTRATPGSYASEFVLEIEGN